MKILKKILLLVVLVFFSACASFEEPNEVLSKSQIEKEITKANENFKKIKSIRYEINHLLTNSCFFYEKPNNIMLETYYLFDKKLELVCDDSLFWFFMKNFDKNSIYYCDPKLLNQTRLKKSLYPEIIKRIVWIDEIDDYNIEDNKIKIKKEDCIIEIKIKEGKVINQNFQVNGLLVATVRTEAFQTINEVIVPKTITVSWHEENREEKINLGKAKLNERIKIKKMPNNLKKINLKNI